jgi:phosphoribosylformylglycinamidine (FGAM) synthase PurS component
LRWKIEVRYKPETPDAAGAGIFQDIADLGITGVKSVRTAQVYWLGGALDRQEIDQICAELLTDPVTQAYKVFDDSTVAEPLDAKTSTIEVRFKPGVTDAVGDSVVKGLRDSGVLGVQAAQTGRKYWIRGNVDRDTLETIAQRLLANDVIQTFEIGRVT